jgi:hypothetical protein
VTTRYYVVYKAFGKKLKSGPFETREAAELYLPTVETFDGVSNAKVDAIELRRRWYWCMKWWA